MGVSDSAATSALTSRGGGAHWGRQQHSNRLLTPLTDVSVNEDSQVPHSISEGVDLFHLMRFSGMFRDST